MKRYILISENNNQATDKFKTILSFNRMEEKDKLIASLRDQLRKTLKKNSALEQENALLNHEIKLLKKRATLKIL